MFARFIHVVLYSNLSQLYIMPCVNKSYTSKTSIYSNVDGHLCGLKLFAIRSKANMNILYMFHGIHMHSLLSVLEWDFWIIENGHVQLQKILPNSFLSYLPISFLPAVYKSDNLREFSCGTVGWGSSVVTRVTWVIAVCGFNLWPRNFHWKKKKKRQFNC